MGISPLRRPAGTSDQMPVGNPPELGELTPEKARRQSTGSWSATKSGTTVTFHQGVKHDNATGRGDSRSISLGSMPAQYGPPPTNNKPAAPTELGTPTPLPRSHTNPFTMMAPPSLATSFDMMSISAGQATKDLSASLDENSQLPLSDIRHTPMTLTPATREKRVDGAAVAGNIVAAQNQVMAHFTPALGQNVPVSEKTTVSQGPIMHGGQSQPRPNLIQTPFNQAVIPAPKLIPMTRDPTSWPTVIRLPNPGPAERKQQPKMAIGGPGRLKPSGQVAAAQEDLDDDFDIAPPLPQSSRSKKEELEDEDYTPPSSRRGRPRASRARPRKGSNPAPVDDTPDVMPRAPTKAKRVTAGSTMMTKKTVRFESPTPTSTTQAATAMNPAALPNRVTTTPFFAPPATAISSIPSTFIPNPIPQSALAPSGTSSAPSNDAYQAPLASIPPPSLSAAPVNRTTVHTPEKRADVAASSPASFRTSGLPETPPTPTPWHWHDPYLNTLRRGSRARRLYINQLVIPSRPSPPMTEQTGAIPTENTDTIGGEPSQRAETESGNANASSEGAGSKRKREGHGETPQTVGSDENQDMPSEMPDPKRQK